MIQQNAQTSGSNSSGLAVFKEFKRPELYKPFLIMLAFFAIQQLSGIFVIFIYAAQFSLEAGVVIDEFLSTVIIGVIRCVMTFIVAFASDKFGRKPIAVVSSSGMFIGMVGLALCSFFALDDTSFFWLPTALLYFFIVTGTIGILALPFSMVAELYPQKSRSLAVGLSLSFCFLLSFFTVKTFSAVFEFFWQRHHLLVLRSNRTARHSLLVIRAT
jgi:facilitated trehalose transporter